MGDSQRAAELVAKADATLKKWTYFLGGDKHEDALELYEKAANLYKMSKNCELYLFICYDMLVQHFPLLIHVFHRGRSRTNLSKNCTLSHKIGKHF